MQSGNDPPPSVLPPGSASDTDNASSAFQRQLESPQLSYESLEPESSNAPGITQTLNQPPSVRGSSRDANEMHRSSPEAPGSIKYTRTGRVSKATKGQRVHHCEECGKIYTRAEHLRRHQQNHKPGAFPCDFPGCSRSFYREDLLIRHKARHNDPHNPPSRRHSIGSQSSAPDPGGFASAPASTPGLSQPPTSEPANLAPELQQMPSDSEVQQSNAPSRAPKRVPVPPNELSAGSLALAVESGDNTFFLDPWSQSSPLRSPTYNDYGYELPEELSSRPYYQPPSARPRYTSDASYLAYGHAATRSSCSPESAGSSNPYIPQWPFSTGCEAAYANIASAYSSLDIPAVPYGHQGSLSGDTRDYMEMDQLDVLGLQNSAVGNEVGAHIFEYSHYVDAYWTGVHELYPVVHRPSYDHVNANPLLRAAILALGAQAVGDRTNLSNGRILHEKCLKVLKKRNLQATNTYRVCDMQAIILVEVYSIFKSRRPPLQLSENFEKVYNRLSHDPEASILTPSASPRHDSGYGECSIENADEMEILCKQRLWLACYALEQQHNLLFGRTSSFGFAGASSTLPFPSSQARWDDALSFDTAMPGSPHCETISDALKTVSYMDVPSQPHDVFQSMLMMACACDTSNDTFDWANLQEGHYLTRALEQSCRARLAFHTFALCKNTPMRALLAVAGESWVMAEKLTTQAEYTCAQTEVRHWIARTSPLGAGGSHCSGDSIQFAMRHALNILKIHQNTPRTGLLFHEWAVYLATIVVWAYTYVLRSQEVSPQPVPDTMEAPPAPHEVEQSITTLVSAGPTAVRGWTQTQNVLRWTKMKIEHLNVSCTCGLTSGALDVLSKLVTRGNEDDWF